MTDAKMIELDGSNWANVLSFLAALQTAIGAPDWHGFSPAAFVDTMIWHDCNALKPPYTIEVKG